MASPIDEELLKKQIPLRPSKKKQSIEVGVFLFLIVPSMIISLFVTEQHGLDFPEVAAGAIVRDLSFVSLILYFIWNNNEPVQRLGLTTQGIWKEILLGLVLYFPLFLAVNFLETLLIQAGLKAPSESPSFLEAQGYGQYVLGFILVVVVAISEEIIFRGYLLLRFSNALNNTFAAALLSAVIFSLGHGYEGSAGIVTVGTMGFIFAMIYLWRMSLIAPIVMHFLQDFIGIVLAPMLSK
jgi:membrane protease YdiL (CAAX protease family)